MSQALLTVHSVPNMFSTAHSRPHANRKRMLAHVYSKSFLQSSTPSEAQSRILIHDRLLPKVARLANSSLDGLVEVHALMNALTMDFTTAYLFGLANSSDFLRNDEKFRWQMHLFHCRRPFAFWAAELPGVVTLLSWFGLGEYIAPKFARSASQLLEEWSLGMLEGAEALLSTSPVNDIKVEDTPVVYMQLRCMLARDSNLENPQESVIPVHNLRLSLASEMLDHLGAGQETSGITLTYALWELAHNPGVQKALRKEVCGLSPSLQMSTMSLDEHTLPRLPSAKYIAILPLLDAVLMETLRLHAAIPGPQPRITPPSASTSSKLRGDILSNLPGGIRVSSQAHSLHRLTSVFPDPETWSPSRWLTDDESFRREMLRHFWAFGSGGRMCIGSNLATQTMKLTIASIVANFVILPEGDGMGDVMQQEDAYVAQPRGMKCVLRFEKFHRS